MSTATQNAEAAHREGGAFEFVQALARELSSGRIELPSFPDVAIRVQRALADENVRPDTIVRLIGSEPALAAWVLRMSNSAAMNVSGRQVNDLRTAITRLGFNVVRSAAVHEHEHVYREHGGNADLTDVLLVGDLLASFHEWPDSLELNLQGVHAVTRLDLDRERLERVIAESASEIAALRQALGN